MIQLDSDSLTGLGFYEDDTRPLRKYQYIMDLGKIPNEVTDANIEPHALSGCREVWLKIDRNEELAITPEVIEAAACFALSGLVVTLGVFFNDGAANVPREVAEMDYKFPTGEDVLKLSEYWKTRGTKILNAIPTSVSGDYVGVQLI